MATKLSGSTQIITSESSCCQGRGTITSKPARNENEKQWNLEFLFKNIFLTRINTICSIWWFVPSIDKTCSIKRNKSGPMRVVYGERETSMRLITRSISTRFSSSLSRSWSPCRRRGCGLGQLGVRIRERERRASGRPWVGNRHHRQPRSKWGAGLRGRSSKRIPCWCFLGHHRRILCRKSRRWLPWKSSGRKLHREWCHQIQRSWNWKMRIIFWSQKTTLNKVCLYTSTGRFRLGCGHPIGWQWWSRELCIPACSWKERRQRRPRERR